MESYGFTAKGAGTMFEQRNEGTGSEYARIFRLLSAAKEEAEKLQLRNLMHL